MNERFVRSREAVMHARDALRHGDLTQARQWAERAADLAPQSEDPWLILAAVASPRESMNFIRKALQANPQSPRARKGMEWALARLRGTPEAVVDPVERKQAEGAILPALVRQAQVSRQVTTEGSGEAVLKDPARIEYRKNTIQRRLLIPILLLVMGCMVFGFAAWSAVTSPVMASILRMSGVSRAQSPHQSFAKVEIPKPTYTVIPDELALLEPTAISTESLAIEPSAIPSELPTILPTDVPPPTATSIPEPTFTPEATSTPGTLYAEIVADTPTSEYIAPTASVAEQNVPSALASSGVHWIDVDLSQQRVYAYAGDTIVNSFIVSTGTWQTPTVTGKFKIWIKLRSTDMAGPGYYLPDVPYTMYFYKGYALHGTYWHNNFGTPMSHGCVNLSIPDAAWLYDFSYEGTVVNVHN
jgi:lipoprotein-anchoring transpeptidase ErfK/SrfK